MLIGRLKYAIEEIKFIKSASDLKIFLDKGLFLLPRITGKYSFSPVPPSIQIEPTNACNVKCICCPNRKITRKRGMMDYSLFTKVIDEAERLGVRIIHLFMHGEPFLHPRIVDMIRYVKGKRLSVHITTNSMALEPGIINEVLQSGLDSSDHIVFSVLGNSRHTHETIMEGVRREKVLANVSEFVRRRTELRLNGPVLETIFYELPENTHEKEDFPRFWKGKVDHARVVAISKAYSKFQYGSPGEHVRQKTCSNIWERMIIYWNGDVTVCSQDMDGAFSFGNAREHSIRELWNNPRLMAIRDSHRKGDFNFFPLCRNCDM